MEELIKEFHKLYAKYKRPEYLEIAGNLGRTKPDTFSWEQKVNEGCKRNNLPNIYP